MDIFSKIINVDSLNEVICGLTSELKSIYIYNNFVKKNKSLLVVCSSLFEANKLYNSILNYTNNVYIFPMDDFLTSEALAISPELKNKRLETINSIMNNKLNIVITNLMGYLRYLPLKDKFNNSKINIKRGDDYNLKELKDKLYKIGYEKEPIINRTGQIAIRGFVLDIFPINYINPIRIEFWGDTIDSIREFDIDSQLTINNIDCIEILPNTEFLIDQNIDIENFKQRDLIKYGNVTSISSYLENNFIIFDDYTQLISSYEHLLDEIYSYDTSLEQPNKNYMNDFYKLMPKKNLIKFETFDNNKQYSLNFNAKEIEPFIGSEQSILSRLNNYLKLNKIVIVCLSNRYKVNKIIENLKSDNIIFTDEFNIINNKINIILKKINYGFEIDNYVVISESELFNRKDLTSMYKSSFKLGKKIKDITKLEVGDYIVHSFNGIGIYLGIKSLVTNGLKKDYIVLEYKDSDKLYVPVEKIELISKYSSNDGFVPKINKLGSSEWAKTKLRLKKKIEDIALDLLKLYSEREASKGFAFSKDTEEQIIFESQFPYKETSDQLRCSKEIKDDMEKISPMDRLLCGDVGYGKTEVAFRAIFKAILSGKQVAFLCPTTILSSQHYKNAIERFKFFPVNIALLNRFVSNKEALNIIKDLSDGKIDLLIGTHRILSDDIKFKDLGLLVIDEEQRFGVKHKEKIKKYKINIDVLTLSATPIPRTLQMSMTGIRSLSLIETPPVDRYPIQTYVLEENNNIIKDAIYKELSRNGQIFILFNNIEQIEAKAKEINRLIPEARVVYAHGRMDKNTLENIMIKFTNYEYDILVCTTIIETGIDIPLVNTLLIIDADRFGLSQLYQIRGRVGRSNRIAYCYLMYKKNKILSEIATKRLKAIKDFTELGSGFAIAMRDLSIRGAGSILGSEQAGFIDSVGTELFLRMLNNEINRLKGVKIEEETNSNNQPLLAVSTSIDDSYISDEELKIEIHKKINQIDSIKKLNDIKFELEDRFGKLSDDLIIYMHEELFESRARKLNITNIKQTKNFIEIILDESITNRIDGQKLFNNINKLSRMYRFSLNNKKLSIILDIVKLDKHFIYYLLNLIDIIENSIKKD